jgi:metallo-beta-lactamase family protein
MTKCFEKNILNHLNNKGTVIAPVFSLGRSQEILYELKQMQEKGLLDTNIPIYFDGKLAFKYTRMFLNDLSSSLKDDAKDFLPKNLTFVGSDNRDSLLSEDNLDTKIILTTSGMGSYGPAQLYIPKYITREDALIHFTGYVAEGTLGRKLKNAKKGETVEVFGSKLQKLADVEYTSEYSAHAKADEMISFLKKFNNLKLVLINHGEADAKYEFAEKIRQEVRPKDVEVLDREHFARVSPYGLVKTVPSKFPTSQGISSKVSGY